MNLIEEIKRVEREADLLLSEAEVEAAIDRVADEITERIGESRPIVLTVLNGGIIFAGKLLTRLRIPLELDSINASRYRARPRRRNPLAAQAAPVLQGRTVLLVDDVLDEGVTLAAVTDWCKEQGASQVLIAVLIDKQIGRVRPCRADFVGLEAENRYLFGYGMDYKSYLRNAPGIFACKGL